MANGQDGLLTDPDLDNPALSSSPQTVTQTSTQPTAAIPEPAATTTELPSDGLGVTTAAPTDPTAEVDVPVNVTPVTYASQTTPKPDPLVAGTDDTVAGQLTGLLDSDSPYMQAAETEGLQGAASRGLLNTSMAVGAAETARIKAALPIAQQDAGTSSKYGMMNQDFANQDYFKQVDFANKQMIDQIATDSNMDMANKEAFGGYVSEAGQRYQMERNDIATDPGMSVEEKNNAIGVLDATYSSNMQMMGDLFGVDLAFEDLGIEKQPSETPATYAVGDQTFATTEAQNTTLDSLNLDGWKVGSRSGDSVEFSKVTMDGITPTVHTYAVNSDGTYSRKNMTPGPLNTRSGNITTYDAAGNIVEQKPVFEQS